MNTLQLGLTLVSVLAIAGGQLLFKLAAQNAERSAAGFPWEFASGYMAAALAVYAAATLLWVWVLKSVPLNIAYPFMGLAFIVVPVFAWMLLGEPLDWRHLAGGLLIIGGIAVVSWR